LSRAAAVVELELLPHQNLVAAVLVDSALALHYQ
jgi:hypothetical protein